MSMGDYIRKRKGLELFYGIQGWTSKPEVLGPLEYFKQCNNERKWKLPFRVKSLGLAHKS